MFTPPFDFYYLLFQERSQFKKNSPSLVTASTMNCPSRPDNIEGHPDWNQNPQALSSDLTTQADLNGIANQREQRNHGLDSHLDFQQEDRA
jgi:hypothetical protein